MDNKKDKLKDKMAFTDGRVEHLSRIENYVQEYMLARPHLYNDTSSVFKDDDLINIIFKTCDFVIDTENNMARGYVKNNNLNIYEPLDLSLKIYVDAAISKLRLVNKNLNKRTAVIKDQISVLTDESIIKHYQINKAFNVEKLRKPPTYLIKFNNGVLNMKTKEFSEDVPDNYHFLQQIPYDYKSLDDCNPESVRIVNEVFNGWSNGLDEIKKYLYQVTFATIEGNGRNKYHIFKSEGGDGKSTFGNILKTLVSERQVANANMDDFDNDNFINTISLSTKLVLGDDIASDSYINKKRLTRLKSLVTGGNGVLVNVKYESAISIYTNAVFIQMANTDPRFTENTDAVKDRLIVIDWPHNNFRKRPRTDFNLDQLVATKDKNFFEALIATVVNSIDYFDRFDVPEVAMDNAEMLVNNADPVYLFLFDAKQNGLLDFERVQTKALYDYFKLWFKENNPGGPLMSNRTFLKKLEGVCSKFKFKMSSESLTLKDIEGANKLRYNAEVFNRKANITESIDYNKKSKYLYNDNNKFTKEDAKVRLEHMENDDSYRESAASYTKDLLAVFYAQNKPDLDLPISVTTIAEILEKL